MMDLVLERYHYGVVFFLMMTGLFICIDTDSLAKRLMGLSIFQTSVFLFYIALGKVAGGGSPILMDAAHHDNGHQDAVQALAYSNPLPHVLILTAIVVGVATLAVGLTLIVRIYHAYGSNDDAELALADRAAPESGETSIS